MSNIVVNTPPFDEPFSEYEDFFSGQKDSLSENEQSSSSEEYR